MTVTTLPRAAAKPRWAPAPSFVVAAEAFRVLRAWRGCVARTGDGATSGFALLNAGHRFGTGQRTLVLATDGLGAPPVIAPLRTLDDWAIEILLRTAPIVRRSLVVGVRHQAGHFELLAWKHTNAAALEDARVLLNAMTPWLGR
jgi:hypothetical protein